MRFHLAKWLLVGRTVQLLGSLVSAASHGYFTIRLKYSRLDLPKEIMTIELLACLLLGYSILTLVVQRTSRRSQKTRWLKAFVVCDILSVAALLGTINVLARAGLPSDCAGLTRSSTTPVDPDEDSLPFFTLRHPTDEDLYHNSGLDKHCLWAGPYYAISNILIFTYIFTAIATLLQFLQSDYTKNTRIGEVVDSLERADGIQLKLVDSPVSSEEPRSLDPHPAPPSEGIITRTTSLRSTLTTSTTAVTPPRTGASAVPSVPRRPLSRPPTLPPRRPVPSTSLVPPSRGANNPELGFASPPPPLPSSPRPSLGEDENAEAALVTDGMMRHLPPVQHHQHYQHHRHQSSQPVAPFPRMPMLSEEDQSADAALVSDGMRPSDPSLPPYQPGNRRMSGHSGDNEMRLSGYVKGQTRAQNMKDSGNY